MTRRLGELGFLYLVIAAWAPMLWCLGNVRGEFQSNSDFSWAFLSIWQLLVVITSMLLGLLGTATLILIMVRDGEQRRRIYELEQPMRERRAYAAGEPP